MNEKQALFYHDFYATDFSATVLSCNKLNNAYEIILDKTLFYPEGGGQPGDVGRLNEIAVIDTYYSEDNIVHKTYNPIEPGTTVAGKINWNLRYKRMQSHSGEHIISGIIFKKYGFNNVGFHMNDNFITIDYDGKIPKDDIKILEIEFNNIIAKNLPIQKIEYANPKDCNIMYRSKKEINTTLKIINIPEVDSCACCGTHVNTTSEINLIHIISHNYYKSGTRIEVVIGLTAIEYIINTENILNSSAMLLSAPKLEIESYIKDIISNNNNNIFELNRRIRQLCDIILLGSKIIDDVLVINLIDLGNDGINYVSTKIKEDAKIIFVYSDKYFFIKVNHENSIPIIDEIKKSNFINGGGRLNYLRGELKIDVSKFISFLHDLIITFDRRFI